MAYVIQAVKGEHEGQYAVGLYGYTPHVVLADEFPTVDDAEIAIQTDGSEMVVELQSHDPEIEVKTCPLTGVYCDLYRDCKNSNRCWLK